MVEKKDPVVEKKNPVVEKKDPVVEVSESKSSYCFYLVSLQIFYC